MPGWFERPSTSKLFFEVGKMLGKFSLPNVCLHSGVAPEFVVKGKRAWKARRKKIMLYSVSNLENRKYEKPNLQMQQVCLFLTDSLLISLWKHLWSCDCCSCVCSSNFVSNQTQSYLLPGSPDPLCMLCAPSVPFLGMFAVKGGLLSHPVVPFAGFLTVERNFRQRMELWNTQDPFSEIIRTLRNLIPLSVAIFS